MPSSHSPPKCTWPARPGVPQFSQNALPSRGSTEREKGKREIAKQGFFFFFTSKPSSLRSILFVVTRHVYLHFLTSSHVVPQTWQRCKHCCVIGQVRKSESLMHWGLLCSGRNQMHWLIIGLRLSLSGYQPVCVEAIMLALNEHITLWPVILILTRTDADLWPPNAAPPQTCGWSTAGEVTEHLWDPAWGSRAVQNEMNSDIFMWCHLRSQSNNSLNSNDNGWHI